ncbi:hypothetical protein D3C73_1483460 [compost metagenome]
MRALACSLGAGGYNAETLTADQLVGKVQWGIDNIITVQEQRLADAERRNNHLEKILDECRYNFNFNKTETMLIGIIDGLLAHKDAALTKPEEAKS